MATAVRARTQRDRLLEQYRDRLVTNPRLDRSLVSFQANRGVAGFSWLRYREAFSAALARLMIEQYASRAGTVLDPFAGIGTTLFTARELGRLSIGMELLPVGAAAIEARLALPDPRVFAGLVRRAASIDWAAHAEPAHDLRHIPITRGAFDRATERALSGYRAWCARRADPAARRLLHVAALDVLESVSFTRKDGQYLRWDGRAPRPGRRSAFRKTRITPFGEAIATRLAEVAADLRVPPPAGPAPTLLRGSCLDLLPDLEAAAVDLVLTSPPYCNRYDYTRTYALELVYLGLDEDAVKSLRQTMLSCTVENAAKVDELRDAYARRGRPDVMSRVLAAIDGQAALREVLALLEGRRRELNNPNIPRMVRHYFLEMAVVIDELARVVRPGGRVVMVNDNVRYAGEEVPVDLILSDLAASLGFEVEHVWKLARGKGNSSQQMGAHGRAELRKGVYVWKKKRRRGAGAQGRRG